MGSHPKHAGMTVSGTEDGWYPLNKSGRKLKPFIFEKF
jgi:hypothetical protein